MSLPITAVGPEKVRDEADLDGLLRARRASGQREQGGAQQQSLAHVVSSQRSQQVIDFACRLAGIRDPSFVAEP